MLISLAVLSLASGGDFRPPLTMAPAIERPPVSERSIAEHDAASAPLTAIVRVYACGERRIEVEERYVFADREIVARRIIAARVLDASGAATGLDVPDAISSLAVPAEAPPHLGVICFDDGAARIRVTAPDAGETTVIDIPAAG